MKKELKGQGPDEMEFELEEIDLMVKGPSTKSSALARRKIEILFETRKLEESCLGYFDKD